VIDDRGMFVRIIRNGRSPHESLQIVESRRKGRRVVQKSVGMLGRRDQLIADGRLWQLVESLVRALEQGGDPRRRPDPEAWGSADGEGEVDAGADGRVELTLAVEHSINGIAYGPGRVVVEPGVAATLQEQEDRARRAPRL
jgi:hypothetical protein